MKVWVFLFVLIKNYYYICDMEKRFKFVMRIPKDILSIKNVFKTNGFNLFIVGGAVRDGLLGIIPKDFDLATDATPDKVEEMMKSAGFTTLATGKAFGVINVFTDNNEYEIATFREDIGIGRRPDSVVFTNIEGDVKRRDLTINALFYDLETNEVVDLVGGIDDIKNNIIRTVGAAEDRFGEDRLRILRAIRFAGRFGSDLDPSIDAALKKDASLEGISGERIRDEFLKGLKSAKSVVSFLKMVDNYFLFDWVFKDLVVDKRFIESNDKIVVLAKLLRHNQPDVLTKTLNSLKYSVDEIRDIVFLIKLLDLNVDNAFNLKRIHNISKVTSEQIISFMETECLDSKLVKTFIDFNLTVTGDDIINNFGIKQGPELGEKKQSIETENFKTMLKTTYLSL